MRLNASELEVGGGLRAPAQRRTGDPVAVPLRPVAVRRTVAASRSPACVFAHGGVIVVPAVHTFADRHRTLHERCRPNSIPGYCPTSAAISNTSPDAILSSLLVALIVETHCRILIRKAEPGRYSSIDFFLFIHQCYLFRLRGHFKGHF